MCRVIPGAISATIAVETWSHRLEVNAVEFTLRLVLFNIFEKHFNGLECQCQFLRLFRRRRWSIILGTRGFSRAQRCSILDNQLQRLLHLTSRRWPLAANQLSRPKSGLNWFNRTSDWFGAIKEIALRSRGFPRGPEIKAWPKPETAQESLWHPGYWSIGPFSFPFRFIAWVIKYGSVCSRLSLIN